jgi:branched-chain amino acid transport system ATP-binding protein
MHGALAVQELSVSYGGVGAVHGVSFELSKGECTVIIGANGAGKTSIVRAISGLGPMARGSEVWLDGRRVTGMKPDRRARLGLGHVLEHRHIFPNLPVRQNLELGGVAARARGLAPRIDYAYELFPDLREMQDRPAGTLSGGQQQFLAMARAIVGAPTTLLLDEPTVGLAPRLIETVAEAIRKLLDGGTTILLVEQALEVVGAVGATVHILSHGRLVAETAASDPNLAEAAHAAYLGVLAPGAGSA